MLGVFGQQCYVGLYGALVLRCCSVFQKKNKKTKGERCFSVSGTGGAEGKIRVLPIKSQTYDLLGPVARSMVSVNQRLIP